MKLKNQGPLITIAGTERCLGHLFCFPDHGVFDADYGRVDVDPGDVDAHNHALSTAMVNGLDDQCKVGQGSHGYLQEDKAGKKVVSMFTGEFVSDQVRVAGQAITFWRGGRKFRGRLCADGNGFRFRRVE